MNAIRNRMARGLEVIKITLTFTEDFASQTTMDYNEFGIPKINTLRNADYK